MPKIKLIAAVILTLLFWSCKNTEPLQSNQYILWSNEFKGNKNISNDELLEIIPNAQRPNAKPLNLPLTPKVWWYNIGINNYKSFNKSKKDASKILKFKAALDSLKTNVNPKANKINRLQNRIDRKTQNITQGISWFWRNVGEREVKLTEAQTIETAKKLNRFLYDIGYRDAEVKANIKLLNNGPKVAVIYDIIENTPYKVDSVIYDCADIKIDSILKIHAKQSFISKSSLFDLRLVNAEKIRIEQLLRNRGYYNFNIRYINHWATTTTGSLEQFKSEKKGILKFDILNPVNAESHQVFEIAEVNFKSFDPSSNQILTKPDTIIFDQINFIRLDKNIPVDIIRKRILTTPSQIFNQSNIAETQKQLALFNQFAFASSQLKLLDTNKLSLEYFAPLLQKYSIGISPGINNIINDGSTFFGFGVPVSFTSRNRFKQLETIELSTRASYEGQPSPIVTQEKAIRGSLELGLNLNVTLPTLWPFKVNNNLIFKNPRTIFGLGFNYSEPFWGKRQNFKINTNYALQLNRNTNLFLSILDVNLINTVYANNVSGREFLESLVKLQNDGNNLKVTFDPQFVSSFNANLVYNNQNLSKPFSTSKFYRLFVESGGTILNLLNDKNRIGAVEKFFPLSSSEASADSSRAYFRFLKVNADYRKNININKTSSYAFRINLGITNPYGTNKSLPFDKNFFIGGSNSVRAWAPRTLGTGSSKADTTAAGNTIPQPGDILFESSIEYRKKMFRLGGDFQFAAFIDAGNIWKWNAINSPNKINKANFDLNRFYKEIGVGTGLGLRVDFSYFLFRFDWGIKVIDPSRSENQRWVLDEFSFRRKSVYGVNWNFGIGYPF